MMNSAEFGLRGQLLKTTYDLYSLGLNRGTSGNLSVRVAEKNWLVTPSGVPVNELTTESMVLMDFEGQALTKGSPSSEWRFHRDILLSRPEVNAVIHTHSTFATAMSCVHKDIPAFHFMIAVGGAIVSGALLTLYLDLKSYQTMQSLHSKIEKPVS